MQGKLSLRLGQKDPRIRRNAQILSSNLIFGPGITRNTLGQIVPRVDQPLYLHPTTGAINLLTDTTLETVSGSPKRLSAVQQTVEVRKQGVTSIFSATSKGLVPPPGSSTGKFLKDDATWATASGSGAPVGASYVTLGTDATLTSERVLTAGANTRLVDAGAGGALTVHVGDQAFALAGDATSSPGSSQNNLDPTGSANWSVLRLNPSASISITGIVGGSDGRVIVLLNVNTGGFDVTIESDDAGSTSGNRFAIGRDMILAPGEGATFVYDNTQTRWCLAGRGTIVTTGIADQAVSNAKLANMGPTTVKGNPTNATSGAVNIQATVDNTVLMRRASALLWDTVGTNEIANDAVTTAKILASNVTTGKIADLNVTTGKLASNAVDFSKFQQLSENQVVGRLDGSGTGNAVAINVGGGLDMTSQLIIEDNGVTNAKLADMAASTLKGRGSAGGVGDPETITLGSGLSMTGTVLAATGGSVAISSASIPFTDGDTYRRVTVSDGAVTAASKIIGMIRRPDSASESVDTGNLYTVNVVRVASGVFDLIVSCVGWGNEDPTMFPPNETITFYYAIG